MPDRSLLISKRIAVYCSAWLLACKTKPRTSWDQGSPVTGVLSLLPGYYGIYKPLLRPAVLRTSSKFDPSIYPPTNLSRRRRYHTLHSRLQASNMKCGACSAVSRPSREVVNCHADLNKEPHIRTINEKKESPQKRILSSWSTIRAKQAATSLGHTVVVLLREVLRTKEGDRNKSDQVRK